LASQTDCAFAYAVFRRNAVDAEHGERQSQAGDGNLFFDPAVGVIQQGAFFNPL